MMILLIGFMLGSVCGIMTMCLVQINRNTEKELRQVELKKNE